METPLQCYRCQVFGHSAKTCYRREKCVVCAGNHRLSECPKEKVCCAGCGKEHAASYGGCEKAKMAREVENTRANQRITYSEAVQKVAKGREQEGSRTSKRMEAKKVTVEVGTQTTAVVGMAMQTTAAVQGMGAQTESKRSEEHIEEKLGAFIIKCFMTLHTENKKTESQIGEAVQSLYKEVYHRELNEELFASLVKEKPERQRGRQAVGAGKHKLSQDRELSPGGTRGL